MEIKTLPKVRIKKILYATDLSENARYTYAYAVSLANQYQAGLTILHVQNSETPVGDLDTLVSAHVSSSQWNEIKERNRNSAKKLLIGKKRSHIPLCDALDTFCRANVEDGIIDEIVLEEGHPVEMILKVAKERGCDMIVMGSHGHSKLMDIVMGSTTQRVLRRSQIPVLTVRLPATD